MFAVASEGGRAFLGSLADHWPEYLIEAAGLGLFLLSASAFAALCEHPASSVHQAVADPAARRFLLGLAIGLTAISIIYSPWGKRSGAHLNPAVTFTFFRLGKIAAWDAVFYIVAQFAGAALGMLAAQLVAYNLVDFQVKGGWSGPARLHLVPHVNAPVADLPVRRVLGGLHFIADLTLPYGRVLYDYKA